MPKQHDTYKVNRFTVEQLQKVHQNVGIYSIGIGGLPRSHSETYLKRGWLLPFLFAYDELLWGRWKFWFEIIERRTVRGSGPIPQIIWSDDSDGGVSMTRKMLSNCLDHYDSNIDTFADWLLWGLGSREVDPSRISHKLNEHYYRTFDLFQVLDNPIDYLSTVLCEQTGNGYKGALGYYPTPFNITVLMAQLSGTGEEMKYQTVYDPCVGCGAMLLPMSNLTLRAFAQDISLIAVKLCKIQMFWFCPWYAMPDPGLAGFDHDETVSDTRSVEGQAHGYQAFRKGDGR